MSDLRNGSAIEAGDAQEQLREALSELEALWREYDFYIREIAAPGLSGDHVKAELAAVGLEPLPELLVWWGWHNGVVDEAPRSTAYTQFGIPNWSQISLQHSVQIAVEERRTAADLAAEGRSVVAELLWHDDWVPVLHGGGPELMVVRGAEPHRGTLAVSDPEMLGSSADRIDASSLADLISTSIHDIREGNVPAEVVRMWQNRPGQR
jgi:hypothetical protein